MKKVLSLLLSICLLLTLTAGLNFSAYADELPASGSCGENVTYTFNSETGLLTISGTGAMTKYSNAEDSPFYKCDDIKEIVIKEGITEIIGQPFCMCNSLKSISFPSTLTNVNRTIILQSSNIENISVDKNNKIYDSRDNCNAIIKSADNELVVGCDNSVIPSTVTKIGNLAFAFCNKMTKIDFHENLATIGNRAFAFCTSLNEIYIPENVTEIENCAFSACTGVITARVDKNNPVYDSRNNCNAIIETASNKLLYGFKTTTIPYTVKCLESASFADFESLDDVVIPYNVEEIKFGAFMDSKLKNVTVCNPNCLINDFAFSLKTNEHQSENKKVNLIGYENSTTQEHAEKRSFTFVSFTCNHGNTVEYKENEKPSTYTEKGSYDKVTYCSTCGKELDRETVETDVITSTITVHWSSIDGVDLEEPIVIENVNPDSTIKEALTAAGYGNSFFSKDGYVEYNIQFPKPMTEYKDYYVERLNFAPLIPLSAEFMNSKVGEDGVNVYTFIYKILNDNVSAEVKAPVCGISTNTLKKEDNKWDFNTQTNVPIVLLPENAHYHLLCDEGLGQPYTCWFAQCDLNSEPFIGTFEGGKPYYAGLAVVADYGYLFPDSGPNHFTVNGAEVIDYYANKTAAVGLISVNAVHNPVTDDAIEPTFKTEGKTAGSHCSGCGEVFSEQKPIAKLGKASLKKIKKRKKSFKAVWTKVSGVDGYQIQYSRKKNMKRAKTKTVQGANKKTLTVKKLKSGEKYYVRIRAYKKIGNKTCYSAWSPKMKVKTK